MAIFTNQATLSYNNTVTTSNITTGELLEVLSVTKTPLAATYTTGDTAVYVVNLANSGPTALTALIMVPVRKLLGFRKKEEAQAPVLRFDQRPERD